MIMPTRPFKLLLLSLFLASLYSTALAGQTVIIASGEKQTSATLTFDSAELISMTKIPFRLRIPENSEVAAATCDLTMPSMPMPENRPALDCAGATCTGTAIFTMSGAWQATCEVSLKDGTRETNVFDIEMVKMK